jgi:protein-S-isoprenylcysteine O-methyltransferase Ste14
MVLFLVASTLPLYIGKEKSEHRHEGEPTADELERTTRIAHAITHVVILPFALIYSIFVPLKLGTVWFSAGLLICLLGLVMVLASSISYSSAPLAEPMSKGAYAISRHPMYFGMFLGYVGTGVACASWVFLLCALVWIVAWNFGVIEEERILVHKYGDAYREYMNRTPRWIGIPKSR